MQTAKLIVLILILLVFIYIARELRRQRMGVTFVNAQPKPQYQTLVVDEKSKGLSSIARGLQEEVTANVGSFFGNPRETSYIG